VAGFLEALASRVAPGNAADLRRLAGEGLEGDVLLGQLAPRVLEKHFAADSEFRTASLRRCPGPRPHTHQGEIMALLVGGITVALHKGNYDFIQSARHALWTHPSTDPPPPHRSNKTQEQSRMAPSKTFLYWLLVYGCRWS
jgi:hypothetical protein